MTISILVERLTVAVRSGPLIGPPLLEQLSEARRSSSRYGASGGEGGSPMNIAAVELWGDIAGRIADDCRDWCSRDYGSPRIDIVFLHASFMAAVERGEVTEGQYEALRARLSGYDHRISRLLNPPKVIPVPEPIRCPVCRFEKIGVGKSKILMTQQDAVVFMPDDLAFVCRLCATTWSGLHSIARLLTATGHCAEKVSPVDLEVTLGQYRIAHEVRELRERMEWAGAA